MYNPFPRTRRSRTESGEAPVVVYGTSWCAATQMVRRYLDRLGIPYVFRDMERDPVAAGPPAHPIGGYRIALHVAKHIRNAETIQAAADHLRRRAPGRSIHYYRCLSRFSPRAARSGERIVHIAPWKPTGLQRLRKHGCWRWNAETGQLKTRSRCSLMASRCSKSS